MKTALGRQENDTVHRKWIIERKKKRHHNCFFFIYNVYINGAMKTTTKQILHVTDIYALSVWCINLKSFVCKIFLTIDYIVIVYFLQKIFLELLHFDGPSTIILSTAIQLILFLISLVKLPTLYIFYSVVTMVCGILASHPSDYDWKPDIPLSRHLI